MNEKVHISDLTMTYVSDRLERSVTALEDIERRAVAVANVKCQLVHRRRMRMCKPRPRVLQLAPYLVEAFRREIVKEYVCAIHGEAFNMFAQTAQ